MPTNVPAIRTPYCDSESCTPIMPAITETGSGVVGVLQDYDPSTQKYASATALA